VDLIDAPKHHDLIYDVGLHKGEDAAFYLRKGFRVVAFEADPVLAAGARTRLADEVTSGQLTIVEGAVVGAEAGETLPATIPFHRNDRHSWWGTLHHDWADRNAKLGSPSTVVNVKVVDFVSVLREHGVPHYLKIDIEGGDLACVGALRRFRERPTYVSIESSKTNIAEIAREVDALAELRYNAFQAVEQSAVPERVPPSPPREGRHVDWRFEIGSSGLFGKELDDAWRSRQAVLRQYRAILRGYDLLGDHGRLRPLSFPGAWVLRGVVRRIVRLSTGAAVPGWYDTHARLSTALRD